MITYSQDSDFFTAGGTLPPDAPSYVKRPTDDELFRHIMAGEFCYVLTPRQMGKSSLMIRTAQRLSKDGVRSAIVDLTQIGTVQSEDQWYKGILTQIARRLRLTVDPVSWWEHRNDIPNIQKFIEFFEEALSELKEPVVIFMDEIDTTLKLDFRDNFFAGVRALFNARAENPDLKRITFVLLGVASPSDLIKDRNRTPFNIGQEILLRPFSRENARMLEKGLEEAYPKLGQKILNRIFYWTNGHPYLTQKLCQTVVETRLQAYSDGEIDLLVKNLFTSEAASRETNLQFVRDNILSYPERRVILSLYKKLLRKKEVRDNKNSLSQNHLKLTGLVLADDGELIISNRIYQNVFDLKWANQNTPQSWNGIGAIAFAILIITLFAVSAYVSIHDYLIDSEVKNNQSSFYSTTASLERLSSLANIFQVKGILRNTDTALQGRELFFSLNKDEQLRLFSDPAVRDLVDSHDLTIVIKELYTTFADLDRSGDSNSLLLAMYESLEIVRTTEGIKLRNEIGFWLKARGKLEDSSHYGTLSNYNQAIILNGENPATRYERARFLISIGNYEGALDDLHELISIMKQTYQNNEVSSNITPINWTHVVSTAQIQSNATLTVSPAFSPAVILTTQAPGLLPSSTPILVTRIPLSTAAVAATTPSSIPTTITVNASGYKSNFYTDIGITSAIRSLLVGNRQIQEKFYANQNIYPNFINSGLIPTLEMATLTTNTPIPSLSVLETATLATNTPSLEIPSEPWWIAFETNCAENNYEIYILRAGEPSINRITNNSVDDGDSVVSPDGKQIAFFSERDGDREIYTMNIDGTDVRRLTYSPGWDGNPAWAPDGKQIAFTSWRAEVSASAVYVMNDDGSKVRRLTSNALGDWMPSWSPDGKQIAYASWVTNEISEIFVINSDGTNRRHLTDLNALSFNPRWSPDGNLIFFNEQKFGQVHIINPDGNDIKSLGDFNHFTNSWSPDSQQIAFWTWGGDGIYIMNADGSNIRLIQKTNLPGCQ